MIAKTERGRGGLDRVALAILRKAEKNADPFAVSGVEISASGEKIFARQFDELASERGRLGRLKFLDQLGSVADFAKNKSGFPQERLGKVEWSAFRQALRRGRSKTGTKKKEYRPMLPGRSSR